MVEIQEGSVSLGAACAETDESPHVGLAGAQTILDSISDYVFILDLDFRILYVNRKVTESLGYFSEELLGETVLKIHPVERHNEAQAIVSEVLAGRTDLCGIPLVTKNGSLIPVETRVTRGHWCGRDVLLGISRDVSDREVAEQTARRASAYNRSLIEASLDPLVTIDLDGRISDVNAAAELITGCSRNELMGTDYADYCTEPEKARAGYQQVLEKRMVKDYPLQIRHKDGHATPVYYNASVYHGETGEVLGVFAAARVATERVKAELELDKYRSRLETLVEERTARLLKVNKQLRREILERKRMEGELRRNEELLRTVLETLPIGVWIVDGEGRLVPGNPAARDIWGGARDVGLNRYGEYKGRRLDTGEIIKPGEWAAARAITKGETTLNEEVEIECFDGNRKIILNSAVPIRDPERKVTGAVVINQDITERKAREMEHARLIAAIEQIAEGIIMTERDWSTQYVNQAFARMSGFTREEIIGYDPRSFWNSRNDEVDVSLDEMRNAVEKGEVWKGRLSSRRKDLSHFDAEVTVSPVRDQSGRITNIAIVERDVSRELEIERWLYQSQKMEAIGTLAGGIAHDFNNVLGVIFGFAQLGLREAPEGSSIRNCLEEIFSAGSRARDLVAQILAFSRHGEQKRSPVEIGSTIKEIARFLRASLPSTIQVDTTIDISDGLDTILADPSQIHQMVMNLCTNAAHAMRENGGVLKMSLSPVDIDSETGAHCSKLKLAPYVRLTVDDTGCGIDPAIIHRVFEPYFTTKEAGEGSGLGLAVVHGIIKAHEGAISVESERGKGTRFHVLLPRTEERPPTESNSVHEIVGGTERILFVDDEQSMVRMWGKLLGPLGYHVVCKTSSLEALEIFRSQPDRFDLVITDQTMPHMTGAELARELLSVRPGVPVILCTGFSESITAEKAKTLGVRELLMKPLVLRSLTEAIRRAVMSDE